MDNYLEMEVAGESSGKCPECNIKFSVARLIQGEQEEEQKGKKWYLNGKGLVKPSTKEVVI